MTWKEAVTARVEAEWRRKVVHITSFPLKARIDITLGCGHVVSTQVANHPLTEFLALNGVELGDELDCPHCATKH